jgi:DUF4097 and DUF4098 domain-containing protein YvlB
VKRIASSLAFVAASFVCLSAQAEELEVNIVYVPAIGAEVLDIEQPMGTLTLRAWDRPEVKIVARKRAPSSAALDKLKVKFEAASGKIRIQTGVRIGDDLKRLPSPRQAIDLTIDAPRGVQLAARTWSGDLDASGFRAGAELRSEGGEVRATDIDGKVRTNALSGRQKLTQIRGDVEADGVTGDLEIVSVDGQLLVARVVEGQIVAREIHTAVVRMLSTSGGIVLMGSLRLGGQYQLTALDGNVTLKLASKPFSLAAHAPAGHVRSSFPIRGATTGSAAPLHLVGDFQGGGPRVEVTAAKGDVLLDPY